MFCTSRCARFDVPPARSSAPADWPRTAAAQSPMPRGWPQAHVRGQRRRREQEDQVPAPARRKHGARRDRGPVDRPPDNGRGRSARWDCPGRPRTLRSALDRVSNQRMGQLLSRGRSCRFQLPNRSCTITATRVKIRPHDCPPRTRRLDRSRKTYCIAERLGLRGLTIGHHRRISTGVGPRLAVASLELPNISSVQFSTVGVRFLVVDDTIASERGTPSSDGRTRLLRDPGSGSRRDARGHQEGLSRRWRGSTIPTSIRAISPRKAGSRKSSRLTTSCRTRRSGPFTTAMAGRHSRGWPPPGRERTRRSGHRGSASQDSRTSTSPTLSGLSAAPAGATIPVARASLKT